jgi:uncharacterized protein with ParB-like and HNH nuclease domain
LTISFVVAALLIKAKQQHGKNQNKNTGLFINCMDFVVVRTKINKKKNLNFFSYAWALMNPRSIHAATRRERLISSLLV